jgi:D-glycero-alpha-D-manno-heptose 1-phosphate guanylyltransferase
MQAIILAGGLGMRLRPLIADLPKPMAPINNKPFLAYLLDYLQSQQITHVTLSLGYQADIIREYFQTQYGAIKLEYAIETTPLGTGGAIVHTLQTVKDKSKPVFILNGDTFLKVNFKAMYGYHLQQAAAITMAVSHVDESARYGCLTVENDRVIAFHEKGMSGPGLINAGVYLVNPLLLSQRKLNEAFSFEHDFLHALVHELMPSVFYTDNYFIDIGVPADYLRAQSELIANLA